MLSACTSSGGFYRSRKRKNGASLKNRKAAAERGGGLYSLSLQTLGRTDCIISARPESQEGHSDEWLTLWEEPWSALPQLPGRRGGGGFHKKGEESKDLFYQFIKYLLKVY